MTELDTVLDHIGFALRPQQVALFEALCETDENATVAQAGTGTGKSIAVLSAGASWRKRTGLPTLVVVPTNVLLLQYINVDAPRVSEALGLTIRALQGRSHYLCSSAPGFAGLTRLPDDVVAQEPGENERLHSGEIELTANGYWFGCPGSEECNGRTDGEVCHYLAAKDELVDADIIITNAHLLIIDSQLKGLPPVERANHEGEMILFQPSIFPNYGALFVDEAHTLEDSLRSFATRSIPANAIEGFALRDWLIGKNRRHRDSHGVQADGELVNALRQVSERPDPDPETNLKLKKYQREAKEAAAYILQRGRDGAYTDNEAVLWFDPAPAPRQPKLVSTQINLAGGARRLLTAVPTGLVSGTIPKSLRGALGIPEARFVDCGHPFSYKEQATLQISNLSGSFQAAKDPGNIPARLQEICATIIRSKGGALVIFSSYRDMETAANALALDLEDAGLDLRIQTRESDNRELGQWFKDHGNAVLFGTSSFATGFDAPGSALRLVVIFKLPYPGLDPVTKAIMARSRQRYEDMMLMGVTQAIGRLIRTTSDTGTVFIADSRARDRLLFNDDPMIKHLSEFRHEYSRPREEY